MSCNVNGFRDKVLMAVVTHRLRAAIYDASLKNVLILHLRYVNVCTLNFENAKT